jgi:prophage tail gpP-like protein
MPHFADKCNRFFRMDVTLADSPDDVAIRVGSTDFKGWQTVSIMRSCESMPNSFQMTASTEFMQGPALAGTRPV